MPMDKTGKQDLQYSCQTKYTLIKGTQRMTLFNGKNQFNKSMLQFSIYMPQYSSTQLTAKNGNRHKRTN